MFAKGQGGGTPALWAAGRVWDTCLQNLPTRLHPGTSLQEQGVCLVSVCPVSAFLVSVSPVLACLLSACPVSVCPVSVCLVWCPELYQVRQSLRDAQVVSEPWGHHGPSLTLTVLLFPRSWSSSSRCCCQSSRQSSQVR